MQKLSGFHPRAHAPISSEYTSTLLYRVSHRNAGDEHEH